MKQVSSPEGYGSWFRDLFENPRAPRESPLVVWIFAFDRIIDQWRRARWRVIICLVSDPELARIAIARKSRRRAAGTMLPRQRVCDWRSANLNHLDVEEAQSDPPAPRAPRTNASAYDGRTAGLRVALQRPQETDRATGGRAEVQANGRTIRTADIGACGNGKRQICQARAIRRHTGVGNLHFEAARYALSCIGKANPGQ